MTGAYKTTEGNKKQQDKATRVRGGKWYEK